MYDFSGLHEHSIDDKGRVSIPSGFREKLRVHGDASVFVTRSLNAPCIEAYPASEWSLLLERVLALPRTHKTVIAYRRRFISQASEVTVDRAGRILLPGPLRAQLGLERSVVIAGNIEKMEIWEPDAFVEENVDVTDGQEVLDGMTELGF